MDRRHGRPEEEMFLPNKSTSTPPAGDDPNIPAVGPLRIHKTASPAGGTTANTGASAAGGTATAPDPLSFPTPPKNPLPYPDDRPAKSASPPSASGAQHTSPRTRFSANDPLRPTVSGYAHAGRPTSPPSANAGASPGIPGSLEPGHGQGDTDGLFQRAPQRGTAATTTTTTTTTQSEGGRRPSQGVNPFPEYHQQYWPAPSAAPQTLKPSGANAGAELHIPDPAGINRLSSTASTSTTRAQRGSPPPPETPAVETMPSGAGGIEARYAAAGVAGSGTLSAIQAQTLAAQQRAGPYQGLQPGTGIAQATGQQSQPQSQSQSQQQSQPGRRPWTPTEEPGSQPHGPPTVYHGNAQVGTSPPAVGAQGVSAAGVPGATPGRPEHPLEQDMSRLHMAEEPPPAYSTLQGGAPHPGGPAGQGYPNEKAGGVAAGGAPVGGLAAAAAVGGAAGAALGGAYGGAGPAGTPMHAPVPGSEIPLPSSAGGTMPATGHQTHPAFANDPRQQAGSPQAGPSGTQPYQQQQPQPQPQDPGQGGSPAPGSAQPASPPPLPEGWIAHLDPNSGQYYYIHLATQSTQWEFPKGPTPLNLNEPMSPTGTFVNPLVSPTAASFGKPLASPGLPIAQTATYHEGMVGVAGLTSPTAAGFTGPPPSAGVDIYKVQPTNGVYFGPYLRYTNMDLERGLWLGSILLITDAPQPPTIHIHQSTDLSPNPRQLKPNPIYSHQRYMFYRYDIDLKMEEEGSAKWTYAITSHLGCTRYEFLVAGRYETAWRFIAHSGNDFALNVSANERSRLGGVGFMWKDILQKHIECNGFHAQLGLGDQIYADRMWKELPLLRQWTATSGKDNRKNAPWTARHEEDVTHAYFHYYTSHFDQPHVREAFAQIPHILTLDDHDIFDGFGSYPEYMQFSNMFKNIGRIGIEMYLLFQHHTTLEILRNVSTDLDLFTITGTGWHFVKHLGPAVVVVGPDTRSERNPHQVMAGPTYQGLFPKVALLPPSVQHCIWMVPVPLVYPRLESMEHLAQTVATGKKVATGTFNMLGKVTSSVAGVVGAKGVVGEGFNSVKKAVGKSGLMSGVLSPFGELGMSDELRDSWAHESKDLERTYLIRTLQGISHNKSLRMTFFSGDVNCCGAGLFHDPAHPQDHKTMYQIISSAVVNAPPSNYVLRLLHNNRPLYVPANGHRSTHQVSDTKEDMMEIFATDVTGAAREMKKLMGRRNYVACVAYDPEVVESQFGQATPGPGSGRVNLAVDFLVQNEGVYGQPMKYGPVIVPSLEYGR